ncbi:hypothetical protein [Streptomyces diastaticus]|uniref:hypothetical protein n=1 Tax=Streptomyces diastaticus TaxID=1956 RepID=UPI0035D90036
MRRAGHRNADALFDAVLEGRSGITFTEDEYNAGRKDRRRNMDAGTKWWLVLGLVTPRK